MPWCRDRLICMVGMTSHMVIKRTSLPQNLLKIELLLPPLAWGILAWLKIFYFHTSLNIYQKHHYSNKTHKEMQSFCSLQRAVCTSVYVCEVKKCSLPFVVAAGCPAQYPSSLLSSLQSIFWFRWFSGNSQAQWPSFLHNLHLVHSLTTWSSAPQIHKNLWSHPHSFPTIFPQNF